MVGLSVWILMINLSNLLLYKKENGIIGGDFNSITEKQDSLLHPDPKLSKCFWKVIKLYNLCDSFRQFSRYYVWKGVREAMGIDRCYSWGTLKVNTAAYHAISFSDHLAHVVDFQSSADLYLKESPRKRSIYRIKHWLLKDSIFLDSIRVEFQNWLEIKDHF